MSTLTKPCVQIIGEADLSKFKDGGHIAVEIRGEVHLQSDETIDWVGEGEDGIAIITSVSPPRNGVTKITICKKSSFHD